MAIECRYIFEFPMAQIALDRFWLGLRLVGRRHGARGRRIPRRRATFPHIAAPWRISLRLLLLVLLLRLLLLLLLSLLLRLLLLLLKQDDQTIRTINFPPRKRNYQILDRRSLKLHRW